MKKRMFITGIVVAIIMFITSIVLFIFDLLQPGIATMLGCVFSAAIGLISKYMDVKEKEEKLKIGHDVTGEKNKINGIDIYIENKDIEIKEKIGHTTIGNENEIGGIRYVRK